MECSTWILGEVQPKIPKRFACLSGNLRESFHGSLHSIAPFPPKRRGLNPKPSHLLISPILYCTLPDSHAVKISPSRGCRDCRKSQDARGYPESPSESQAKRRFRLLEPTTKWPWEWSEENNTVVGRSVKSVCPRSGSPAKGSTFALSRMNEWMNERTNEGMNERMNEWMSERMNESHKSPKARWQHYIISMINVETWFCLSRTLCALRSLGPGESSRSLAQNPSLFKDQVYLEHPWSWNNVRGGPVRPYTVLEGEDCTQNNPSFLSKTDKRIQHQHSLLNLALKASQSCIALAKTNAPVMFPFPDLPRFWCWDMLRPSTFYRGT